jgi:hypothetical protein
MLRTIVVTVAAICLTLVLLSFGTFLILRTTQFGKVAMGDVQSVPHPWETFMEGQNLFLLYVDLPTTLLVGFLVGLFAKRFAIAAGIVGTAPISGILLAAGDVWRGCLVIACAAGVTFLAMRLRQKRSHHLLKNTISS